MSVEPLIISALVEEGDLREAFRANVGSKDFSLYEDEFDWLQDRLERRKPITRRLFCERFPEFEFTVPKEKTADLLEELKSERAYSQMVSLIETVSETLLPENAVSTAEHMREILHDVVKAYSPHSDISLKDAQSQYEKVRQHRSLAKAGQTSGMPLLIPTVDFHWDGLNAGRLIGVLGRPGMMKSFFIAWIAWAAIKNGWNIGLFSPEMNEFEHTCRLHTFASADPQIREELGLKQSFRNIDLMRGTGFDLKAYKRFCEYFETLPGDCRIFTKKYRKNPITVQYIAARVEDLGLHGVIADPISKISAKVKHNDRNPVWDAYEKVGTFQEMLEEQNIFGVATNWSTRQQGRTKSEKAPDLDDSFGSDSLAQEADHIMGLRYDAEEHTLTLRCSKSRFGKSQFSAIINIRPNTGSLEEVNIESDVIAYRATLNGSALPNGNSHRGTVEKE